MRKLNIKPIKWIYQRTRTFASESKALIDVNVNEKSGIATVTMQNKPLNVLNTPFLKALSQTFQHLDQQKSRGMILTSVYPTVFSAGFDIQEIQEPIGYKFKEFWYNLQDVWIYLYGSSFPTVAAINGHAPAGGCLLALACEYRVMTNNFTIGLNEVQLGFSPPPWLMESMKAAIGERNAESALIQGRMFTTTEAFDTGLIDDIATDREHLLIKSATFFNRFKRIDPLARIMTKRTLRGKIIKALEKNRESDFHSFSTMINNPDAQHNIALYLKSLKK